MCETGKHGFTQRTVLLRLETLVYHHTVMSDCLRSNSFGLSLDLKGCHCPLLPIPSVVWIPSLRHNASERKRRPGHVICVFLSICHPGPWSCPCRPTCWPSLLHEQTSQNLDLTHTGFLEVMTHPQNWLTFPVVTFFLDLNRKHFYPL